MGCVGWVRVYVRIERKNRFFSASPKKLLFLIRTNFLQNAEIGAIKVKFIAQGELTMLQHKAKKVELVSTQRPAQFHKIDRP